MTLLGLIEQCQSVLSLNPGSHEMNIVFHDADGCAWDSVDLRIDGTCNDDEEVVRFTLFDSSDEDEVLQVTP